MKRAFVSRSLAPLAASTLGLVAFAACENGGGTRKVLLAMASDQLTGGLI